MAGYRVEVSAVRKASAAAVSAGKQASLVDLSSALGGVATAMPGSSSSEAAGQVAAMWRKRIESWSEEAESLGTSMSSAADMYAATDDQARSDLLGYYGEARSV